MVKLGLGFLIGLVLGSLIDCLANRSLTNKSFWGRSYCDSCQKTLHWYDLFPVASLILLRGKCHFCHQKIPFESLYVELISALVCTLIFYKVSIPLNLGIGLVINLFSLGLALFIFCILFILVITDLKAGLIPDRISIPGIITVLISALILDGLKVLALYLSLKDDLLGKLLLPPYSDYFYRHIFLITTPLWQSLLATLGILLFFGGLILFTRGRGMGGGDLKLGVFIGLSLGFPNAFLAILLAFVFGSVVGIALLISRKKHFGQTIPFGPFLSLGSMIALLWGNELINWYFRLNIFS